MNLVVRIVLGLLSGLLAFYAGREIVRHLGDPWILLMAIALLIIAVCGMVNAVKDY